MFFWGGILSAHLGLLHFAKKISGIVECFSHLFLLADKSEVVNHSLLIFIDFLLYFTSLLTSFFSYSSDITILLVFVRYCVYDCEGKPAGFDVIPLLQLDTRALE